MRQVDLVVLISTIILVAGILLAIMPVDLCFFYKWGMDEHSLLLRFEFLGKRVGFGTKILFGRDKVENKYRFTTPFHTSGKQQDHGPKIFHVSHYHKLLGYIRKFMERSICRSFIWETELGFTDYALTGVVTGLLWAGKGTVLGYLSHFLKMDEQNIRLDVKPYFGRKHWRSSVNCIFTTRLGHIIIVFSYFLLWLIKDVWDKKKRGDRIWRTIRSKL